jgi:hypothetical protein
MTISTNQPLNGGNGSAGKMPTPGPRPPVRPDNVRAQYIQVKSSVHRKLLNRLNLEALASVDRQRAESEIRTLLFELLAEESVPLSMA